ncbi:MAG: hypothetical protein GF411_05860 [Candidatus Lokiarchaeota archaeon]|nr:hypothetical protein [Candidatus Lokiarchaeota archaeon]
MKRVLNSGREGQVTVCPSPARLLIADSSNLQNKCIGGDPSAASAKDTLLGKKVESRYPKDIETRWLKPEVHGKRNQDNDILIP